MPRNNRSISNRGEYAAHVAAKARRARRRAIDARKRAAMGERVATVGKGGAR